MSCIGSQGVEYYRVCYHDTVSYIEVIEEDNRVAAYYVGPIHAT